MGLLGGIFTGTGTATALIYISLTAFTGLLIGKIKISHVKLGIAGVLFSGLLIGHLGAKANPEVLHFIREFGLILFVYAIGIDVGPRFFNSFRSDGIKLNLVATGIVLTGFLIAYLFCRLGNVPPAVITGIMSGAVTNTPALAQPNKCLRIWANPMMRQLPAWVMPLHTR